MTTFTFIAILSTATLLAGCGVQPKKVDSGIDTPRSSQQIFWDSLPKPVGYVNDYDNMYTTDEEKTLDSILSDFDKRSTMQIAIITFDTTMTTIDSLGALTLRIANAWGVGQKGKNNGVAIGICRGYGKMRIQNGYGIEKILTNDETKAIIDSAFIPNFKKGKYFEGTLLGIRKLMSTLEENEGRDN